MAKIVFSAVVGDARNKAGGIVFTKSRAGAIVRRKVSPIQPRTSRQSTIRASLTGFAKVWGSTLTDAQRAAWNALAKVATVKDVFGATLTLTGLQLFVKLNQNLATVGVAAISDPPITLAAEYPGVATLAADSVGPTLTILPSVFNTAADYWVIRATPPTSPGRAFAGSKFVIVKTGTTVLAAAQSFLAEYVAKFGALQAGQRIFASIAYYDKTTGAQGLAASANVITT